MSSVEPAPPPYPGPPERQQQQQQVPWVLPFDSETSRNGLEHLLPLETVLLQRKKDLMMALTGIPVPNSYSLKTINDEQVFYLQENSNGYQLGGSCQPHRPFTVGAANSSGNEVVAFVRKRKSTQCIGSCAKDEVYMDDMTVESPPGQMVGRVKQVYNGSITRYMIQDANGESVFRIDGMGYSLCCLTGRTQLEFPVTAADGTGGQVASISKKHYMNTIQQMMTPGADTCTINMPRDLHLDMKITLIGACVLFDFLFFDTTFIGTQQSTHIQNRQMMQYQMAFSLQQQRQIQQQQFFGQPPANQFPHPGQPQPQQFFGQPLHNQFQHPGQPQPQQFFGQPLHNQFPHPGQPQPQQFFGQPLHNQFQHPGQPQPQQQQQQQQNFVGQPLQNQLLPGQQEFHGEPSHSENQPPGQQQLHPPQKAKEEYNQQL